MIPVTNWSIVGLPFSSKEISAISARKHEWHHRSKKRRWHLGLQTSSNKKLALSLVLPVYWYRLCCLLLYQVWFSLWTVITVWLQTYNHNTWLVVDYYIFEERGVCLHVLIWLVCDLSVSTLSYSFSLLSSLSPCNVWSVCWLRHDDTLSLAG